jgi:hypothetical protein
VPGYCTPPACEFTPPAVPAALVSALYHRLDNSMPPLSALLSHSRLLAGHF